MDFRPPWRIYRGTVQNQHQRFGNSFRRAFCAGSLVLLPAVLLGTLAGRWLLAHINQRVFENIVLAVSVLAGLLMIF
jgi:uncharacterized membrane protein YfcA